MRFQISNFQKKDFSEWDKFVKSHSDYSIYQSSEMYHFYNRVDKYSPLAMLCRDDNNNIVGVLLTLIIREFDNVLGWFSSRAIIYGNPIVNQKNRLEILSSLLNELNRSLKKKVVYIQFRNSQELNNIDKEIYLSYGYKYIPWTNLKVRTKSIESVKASLNSSRRRQIKLGMSSGLIIREPNGIIEVRRFYDLLKDLYKRRIHKPFPSISFFENFYLLTKKDKLGIMRIAIFNNEVIGGFIAPVTANKSIHEWYIVGLDKLYQKCYPSVMLTWNMIEYAIQNDIEYFDFMGAGSPDDKYGVRDFKLGFNKDIYYPGRFERNNFLFVRNIQMLFVGLMR